MSRKTRPKLSTGHTPGAAVESSTLLFAGDLAKKDITPEDAQDRFDGREITDPPRLGPSVRGS